MTRFSANIICVLTIIFIQSDLAFALPLPCSLTFHLPSPTLHDLVVYPHIDAVPFVSQKVFSHRYKKKEVPIKNNFVYAELLKIKQGVWTKTYIEFADGRELHFFLHEDGDVAQVKWK